MTKFYYLLRDVAEPSKTILRVSGDYEPSENGSVLNNAFWVEEANGREYPHKLGNIIEVDPQGVRYLFRTFGGAHSALLRDREAKVEKAVSNLCEAQAIGPAQDKASQVQVCRAFLEPWLLGRGFPEITQGLRKKMEGALREKGFLFNNQLLVCVEYDPKARGRILPPIIYTPGVYNEKISI